MPESKAWCFLGRHKPAVVIGNRRRRGNSEGNIRRHGAAVAVGDRVGEASRPEVAGGRHEVEGLRAGIIGDRAIARVAHPGDRQRLGRRGPYRWREAPKPESKAQYSRSRQSPLSLLATGGCNGVRRKRRRPSSCWRWSCWWGRRIQCHRRRRHRRRSCCWRAPSVTRWYAR